MKVDGSGVPLNTGWDSYGKCDESKKASIEHEKHGTGSAILIPQQKDKSERW